MKPALEDVVGKFLHCQQLWTVTPYQVEEQHISYADLPEEHFNSLRPAWGPPYQVKDHSDCHWGSHCFKIGPKGELVFAAECWDTSG